MDAMVKPNILVVFADQLRACSLGYEGQEPVITPNLDRFAAENARFSTAISPTPVCTPYRGSLITGRSALSLGLVINDITLSTDEVSIAHVCRDAGYDTAYIGKWHLDGRNRPAMVPPGPRRQGFDTWVAANFDHNYDRSIYFEGDDPEPKQWQGFDCEAETSRAIEYLEARDGAKPFCLFLSWGPPHHPYRTVPERFLEMYDAEAIPARPNCPEPPRQDLLGYYAQTTFLDEQFGRLTRALNDLGLSRDTIVVFTSDHGDMHGSQGVYKKQWPWDEANRVPFLLGYPRQVPVPSRFDFPISAVDVMPTLLGLAGIAIPESVEGVDLSPFIRGERDDPPASVLLMNPCPFGVGDPRGPDQVPDFHGMRMEFRGVRTARHTYVRTIDRPWLLYDNEDDPYQLANRIDDPALATLRQELEAMMTDHMARIGDEFLPKEVYYERFGLEIDARGKLVGLVENPYDRQG